jgi:hypothetical protein
LHTKENIRPPPSECPKKKKTLFHHKYSTLDTPHQRSNEEETTKISKEQEQEFEYRDLGCIVPSTFLRNNVNLPNILGRPCTLMEDCTCTLSGSGAWPNTSIRKKQNNKNERKQTSHLNGCQFHKNIKH